MNGKEFHRITITVICSVHGQTRANSYHTDEMKTMTLQILPDFANALHTLAVR